MKNKRRFTITVGAVLMVCMLATGYAAVAAEYGSDSDPLITKSYLEHVLTPAITNSANSKIEDETNTYQSAMEKKIVELSQALDNKIASLAASLAKDDSFAQKVASFSSGSGSSSSNNNGNWEVIEVKKDSFLKLNLNSEVIIQRGSATCVESAGTGLTDLSGGSVLNADEALSINHRYIATTKGSGFKATETVTVLVDGGYTLA